jgi:hypothetical protein
MSMSDGECSDEAMERVSLQSVLYFVAFLLTLFHTSYIHTVRHIISVVVRPLISFRFLKL